MQSGECAESAAIDAPQQRELLSRQGLQTQENAVIADPLGNIPQMLLSPEHEVDRLDNKGFPALGCAVDYIQAGPEFKRRRRALGIQCV